MRNAPGLIAALAVALSVAASAQNPPGSAASASKFDTPQARVYIAMLQPHTPVPWRNGHATNRVLILSR